jgi:hypothetical protein
MRRFALATSLALEFPSEKTFIPKNRKGFAPFSAEKRGIFDPEQVLNWLFPTLFSRKDHCQNKFPA